MNLLLQNPKTEPRMRRLCRQLIVGAPELAPAPPRRQRCREPAHRLAAQRPRAIAAPRSSHRWLWWGRRLCRGACTWRGRPALRWRAWQWTIGWAQHISPGGRRAPPSGPLSRHLNPPPNVIGFCSQHRGTKKKTRSTIFVPVSVSVSWYTCVHHTLYNLLMHLYAAL